jgi:hypothetical protein
MMEESKFNVWRACFSFCFVDGFVDSHERKWIDERLATLPLSPLQKQTLMNDLKDPPKVSALLPLITKPSDRSFLVDQIRYLAHIDNDLSELEKAKILKVKNEVMGSINVKSLEEIISEEDKTEEEFVVHNKHSYIERALKGLMKTVSSK